MHRLACSIVMVVTLAACASKPAVKGADGPGPSGGKAVVEDPATLADALLAADEAIAAWSPLDGRIVHAATWNEEGTGMGMDIVFQGKGDEADRISVFEAGGDEDAGRAAARKDLVTKLTGRGYVRMTRVDWPRTDDAVAGSLDVPTVGTLKWSANTLTRASDGKTLITVASEDPHEPSPSAVYYVPGATAMGLLVTMDPGEAYAEGFNVYREMKLIPLR